MDCTTFKKKIITKDNDTTKPTSSNENKAHLGVKKAGYNWETFKHLITETSLTNSNSHNVQNKKKKFSHYSEKKNHSAPLNVTVVNKRQITKTNMATKQKYCSETQTSSINSNSHDVQNKKKKFNHYPQKNNDSASSNVTAVNKQQITKTNIKSKQKYGPENKGLTKYIAMDCEMVGTGTNGLESMIARVSIVNKNGECVYDKYVKPTEEVKDYRTAVSGIRPHHLINGEDFTTVQKEVAEILRGRILVGHGLHNDLAVLFLKHPARLQRDTSKYKLFRKLNKNRTPSLKKLVSELLGENIQSGEHNSVEDARAAMQIYQLYSKKWELDIRNKRHEFF